MKAQRTNLYQFRRTEFCLGRNSRKKLLGKASVAKGQPTDLACTMAAGERCRSPHTSRENWHIYSAKKRSPQLIQARFRVGLFSLPNADVRRLGAASL